MFGLLKQRCIVINKEYMMQFAIDLCVDALTFRLLYDSTTMQLVDKTYTGTFECGMSEADYEDMFDLTYLATVLNSPFSTNGDSFRVKDDYKAQCWCCNREVCFYDACNITLGTYAKTPERAFALNNKVFRQLHQQYNHGNASF